MIQLGNGPGFSSKFMIIFLNSTFQAIGTGFNVVLYLKSSMMKSVLRTLPFCFLIISCSMNASLRKSFTGKNPASLEKHFGKPTTVIPRGDDTLLIFIRKNALESTEISQGRLTLDPIRTPEVNKSERFIFTVSSGKIIDTKYEKVYEKKVR